MLILVSALHVASFTINRTLPHLNLSGKIYISAVTDNANLISIMQSKKTIARRNVKKKKKKKNQQTSIDENEFMNSKS